MDHSVEVGAERRARIWRSVAEKRQIVKQTLEPGASVALIARAHGLNANQVFQWRHEYRKGTGWAARRPRAQLLPVTVTAEPSSIAVAEVASVPSPSTGSIHIELPGRALVSVEPGVDATLVRAVLESLLR